MTYATDLGYKVGDKFKIKEELQEKYSWVVRDYRANSLDDVFVLVEDDGSYAPRFKSECVDNKVCLNLESLEKLDYRFQSKDAEHFDEKIFESIFKVGDKVKVVRRVDPLDPNGMGEGKKWCNSWESPEMDDSIGKEFIISEIDEFLGVRFLNASFNYPIAALEKVEDTSTQENNTLHFKAYADFSDYEKDLARIKELLLEIEVIHNRIFKKE